MGWYLGQQWFVLLLALLIGVLLGYLWFRLRWKRVTVTQQHEVSRLRGMAAGRDAEMAELAERHQVALDECHAARDRAEAALAERRRGGDIGAPARVD